MEGFDGSVQINRYDPEGLRCEIEENGRLVRFIFNPEREAVTEESGDGVNRLIRASELIAATSDADSARTYYHYASDEMGSITHIVDEAGKVQNRYEYDAWGNITAQEENVPNRFKFTGQQFDPVSQQYYLRARFYNPVVARFTQEDTYRDDGLNLYAYCANNPVRYWDPSGHWCEHKQDLYNKIQEQYPEMPKEAAMAAAANAAKALKNNLYSDANAAIEAFATGKSSGDAIPLNAPAAPKADVPTAGQTALNGGGSGGLLPGEGTIGTYKELIRSGKKGDNLTPHHMPSAEYMAQKGIPLSEGLCMQMEMPSPGTGGRHRLTATYGRNMTDAEKASYYSLSPRDALAFDIQNLREIYKQEGLSSEIRPKLLEFIKESKIRMPELFDKGR